jgi:hypothetical protein
MENLSDYLRYGFEDTTDLPPSVPPATATSKKKTATQIRDQIKRIIEGKTKQAARRGVASAASAAPAAAAAGTAAAVGEAAAATGIRGLISQLGLPGIVVGTLAYPIMERLLYGSHEDQMREQMNIQDKLEQEHMSKQGGMGGLAGLAGGAMPVPSEPSMYSLLEGEKMTERMNEFGNTRNRALESLARPSGSEEMQRLLAGDEARVRTLQSPRQLTPYEIMGILNG